MACHFLHQLEELYVVSRTLRISDVQCKFDDAIPNIFISCGGLFGGYGGDIVDSHGIQNSVGPKLSSIWTLAIVQVDLLQLALALVELREISNFKAYSCVVLVDVDRATIGDGLD